MQAFNGDPIKGILLSIVAGAIAGSVTGILITKLNVQPILAGIITMTALYSINLKIMDRPNISLYKKDTIFTMAQKYFGDYYKLAAAGIVLVIAAVLLFWFLKTQAGMSLRATGDNEYMVRASSINSDRMKIMGFAIANALVSFQAQCTLSIPRQATQTAVQVCWWYTLLLSLSVRYSSASTRSSAEYLRRYSVR